MHLTQKIIASQKTDFLTEQHIFRIMTEITTKLPYQSGRTVTFRLFTMSEN